jgi:hypothetical protein
MAFKSGEKVAKANTPAERVTAIKNMATHPKQTFKRKNQSTLEKPLTKPTPDTAPTMHWVDETGMERKEAVTTVNEAASSAQAPREGDNLVNLYPMDFITLYP